MTIADELARLEEAIDLCRLRLAEQELVVAGLADQADAPKAEDLLEALRDLHARQLARREELVEALRSPAASDFRESAARPPRTEE